MTFKNYYYILGVHPNATEQEIKVAYRKLSLKFHPDTNNGDKFLAEMFKNINEAYKILSNPEKRKIYNSSFNASTNDDKGSRKDEEERLRKKVNDLFQLLKVLRFKG